MTNPGSFVYQDTDDHNAIETFAAPEAFDRDRFCYLTNGSIHEAPVLIGVIDRNGGRSFYIAAAITHAILRFGGRFHPTGGHTLGYGPGGRRTYHEVTETLVAKLFDRAQIQLDGYGRKVPARVTDRAKQIQAFALALVDYIV